MANDMEINDDNIITVLLSLMEEVKATINTAGEIGVKVNIKEQTLTALQELIQVSAIVFIVLYLENFL